MKQKQIAVHLIAPKNWDELTEQQVVYVAQVLLQQPTKEELLCKCLLKFTGLHPVIIPRRMQKLSVQTGQPIPNLFHYKKTIVTLEDEQLYSFCGQLEYLAGEPGLMVCPRRLAGLYGPDAQLWNVTFEAYLMADRYYRAFSQSKDEQHLCSMVGVLWRRHGVAYQDNLVERYARRIKRGTKPAERQAVFLWWTGVKLWLKEKYSDLFTPSGDADEPADESDGIMNMLYAITEGKAHENTQVLKTGVHEVLHALNTKARQIHELNNRNK